MSGKGNNRHIKRLAASRYIKVSKKTSAYVAKPLPGRHSGDSSIALVTVIKEKLGLASTSRETRRIMRAGNIIVNGKEIKEEKYPVGYSDTIHMKGSGETFVVGVGRHGTFSVEKASKEIAQPFKVIGKYKARKGKDMIRLHDGRTMAAVAGVSVNDSVVLGADMSVKEVLKFKEGAKCAVYKGVHAPSTGKITEISAGTSVREQSVHIKVDESGKDFETVSRNVIVIGA